MISRPFLFQFAVVLAFAVASRAAQPPCMDGFALIGNQFELSPAPPLGPKKIGVSAAEAEQIRKAADSFYTSARNFVHSYGNPFVDLVSERIPESGNVTIVIAMGGAEHLGTLLERALPKLHPGVHLKFRYVDLSTKRLQFWEARRNPNPGGSTFGPGSIRLSGLGPVPAGYEINGGNSSDAFAIAKHLAEHEVLSSPTVLVIDTGFNGSTVEAVAHVSRNEVFPSHVEGVLVQKSEASENTTPIFGLNNFMQPRPGDLEGTFAKLAVSLDHNNLEGVQLPHTLNAFQRSGSISASKPEELANYKATLQGIEDGLARPTAPYVRRTETVQPGKLIPAAPRSVFRDPPPKCYLALLDVTKPVPERQKAMTELQTWVRESLEQNGGVAAERFFDDVIASTDRFGEAFGSQLKILNFPDFKKIVAQRDQSHSVDSVLRFEDLLGVHPRVLTKKERLESEESRIIGRVLSANGNSGPLHGARNIDEYLKHRHSNAALEFVRRRGLFEPSFNRPLKSAKSAQFEVTDYISRIRRGGPAKLEKIWRGVGLEREFKRRFPDPATFWNSNESFLEIYRELERSRLPPI